jgi:hypothetical protein
MRKPRMALIVLVFVSMVAGCDSDDQDGADGPSSTPEATGTATRSNTLVGRWELSRTCEGMVKALDHAGLRALAPSVAGDYFPDKSPKELARKAEVCQGAEPQQHSHYFTAEGEFGSLDQNGEQVDQQRYRVIDSRKLRIDTEFGPENYRSRIAGGDRLTLEPLIPNRAKRAARAKPLEFGLAGHMAAVAYTGHTWKRVDCDGWC